MVSKVDLHVHSRYSNRPTEWVLRRIGAPECFTPPRVVYDTARRRGMQFVTISDHNCIDGALEIAHLPGAFVSNEITAYFPHDHCKIHVLCWDITEAQFREIQRLRENVFDLRDYLREQGIAHACAHPLYSVNDRLTVAHFEQLLLLFNVFEGLNGARHQRGNDLVRAIMDQLTEEQLADMADRHGVAPAGQMPWFKGFTAGSDDHSGLFIAKAYTEAPHVAAIEAFLEHVRERRSRARGLDGSPLSFAHSLYGIGYQYYRDRFFGHGQSGGELLGSALGEMFRRTQPPIPLRARVSRYARRLTGRRTPSAEEQFRTLVSREMRRLFGDDWLRDDFVMTAEREDTLNRQTFELANRISNQLLFQFTSAFAERLAAGSIFGSVEALSAMLPVLLGLAPYLFSFTHMNRDRALLADVRRRCLPTAPPEPQTRKAWFTDALTDVNGVTTLVRTFGTLATASGHDLQLMCVAEQQPQWPARITRFDPVGHVALPEAESVRLPFPPLLEILEYCDREQFTEIIVSTPGPVGLAALVVGRAMGTSLVGIYHTDLPRYVRYYTEDDAMEAATWTYLRWFYGQMDVVYVPSEGYRRQLESKGFDPARLRLLPHGVDSRLFHPRHARRDFWSAHGGGTGPVVVYVGRVAREKDLDVLAAVFARLAPARPATTFAIVGDGPYRAELESRLPWRNVVFTGFLHGDTLSAAYASSDVFVFPSTTDTFGNVVLEAMASGLPVVVSDQGGPAEIVEHEVHGLITRAGHIGDLCAAVERLLDDPDLRFEMGRHARVCAESRAWDQLYDDFWHGRPTASAGARRPLSFLDVVPAGFRMASIPPLDRVPPATLALD